MKFNINHIKKRIILGFTVCLLSLSLTGCGGELKDFANVELSVRLNERFLKNAEILNTLHSTGLISQSERDTWVAHIDKVKKETFKDLTSKNNSDSEEVSGGVLDLVVDKRTGDIKGNAYRAFSKVHTYGIDNFKNSEGVFPEEYKTILKEQTNTTNDLTYYAFGNFLASKHGFGISDAGANQTEECYNTYDSGKSSADKEYSYISIMDNNKDSDGLTLDLDFKIKVLRPDADIDRVMEILQDPNNINYTELDEEFRVVTDGNGNDITLASLGIFDPEDLIGISEDNNNHSKENKPGLDLLISQEIFGQILPVGTIKFYEFNQDAIDKINNFIGIDGRNNVNNERWLIRKKGLTGSNELYLMEYPVYYVSGFQDYETENGDIDKTRVEAQIGKSDLLVNLKTSQILYKAKGNTSIMTTNGTPYITLGNSVNQTSAEGLSSFILSGLCEVNVAEGINNVSDGAKNIKATTGRIVLRDYLEVTYAPDFDISDAEGLVVLGRKIRLINMTSVTSGDFDGRPGVNVRYNISTIEDAKKLKSQETGSKNTEGTATSGTGEALGNKNLKWCPSNKSILSMDIPLSTLQQTKMVFDKTKPAAAFVNAAGEIVENTPNIMVTDFASLTHLRNDGVIVRLASVEESVTALNPDNKNEKATVDSLPTALTQNLVDFSTKFPGTMLGSADNTRDLQIMERTAGAEDTQMHQYFYTAFLATDMFETGLYSSWLNNPDETASLGWWIGYLNSNGYVYNLSKAAVEEFLTKNYAYELSQHGIVILDTRVVAFIQQQIDNETERETDIFIQTVFVTLGWLLIVYGLVLWIAWQVDTNLDVGLQLVNKMTLGSWIPIKDMEDCPYMDQERRRYVDFKRVTISCVILVFTGILLNILNIYSIVLLLIRTLGVFAQFVSENMSGLLNLS